MHDGFQIGTIAEILFGTMLNRYDTSSLRKEMRQEMSDLRKEMNDRMEALRADVHRSTTLVTELLFHRAVRLTKIENQWLA